MQLVIDEKKTKERQKGGYIGARFSSSNEKVTVRSVMIGSGAWKEGLNYDDEIIALDGLRITSEKGIKQQLEIRRPGDKVSLLISRYGTIENLELTLEEYTVPVYKIEEMKEATDEQLKLRKRWLLLEDDTIAGSKSQTEKS